MTTAITGDESDVFPAKTRVIVVDGEYAGMAANIASISPGWSGHYHEPAYISICVDTGRIVIVPHSALAKSPYQNEPLDD